jgi:hypothetical protein
MTCSELDAGLRARPWGIDRSQFMAWLDRFTGVEDCIADGLRRTSDDEDWSTFEGYVAAADRHPSPAYTFVLCDVLSQHREEFNNEDLVEVLARIRDPASVGCLEELLWWEPEGDEYRHLAQRACWALGAIATPEAIAVLRDATSTGAAEVREAAARELGSAGA